MMMLLAFLAPALLFGIADLAPGIRKGEKKLAVAYLAVLTAGLALWIMQINLVPLKGPIEHIAGLLKAFVNTTD